MALFAIRTHLTPVDIGMAIRAFRPHIGEDQLDVAFDALNLFVHAPEWIGGLIVIELRDSADRLPTREGVAVFAGNRNIAVRIFRACLRRRSALPLCERSTRTNQQEKYEPNCMPAGCGFPHRPIRLRLKMLGEFGCRLT